VLRSVGKDEMLFFGKGTVQVVCGFLSVYLCNGCIEFLFKYIFVHSESSLT
jgi:hypothetical protein